MKRLIIHTSFFSGIFFLLNSFTGDKTLTPDIPPGFPKPIYDLRKNPISENEFELGRKLFYDPVLSSDSTVSCANCHQQFSAFSNLAHPLSHGVKGTVGKRNAPTLQNLVWNKSFMWDGGVAFLEAQPLAPIANKLEMNESLENVIRKLQQNPTYVSDFKKAYKTERITTKLMAKALAKYMAMLVSAQSKYDMYLKGDVTFTSSEERGLKIFRKKCSTCHTEPLFTDNSFRNNGLAPNATVPDSGKAIITGQAKDAFLFKVPSLRNVAVSAPYMHDGRFATLQQVVNHYDNGVTANATTDALVKEGIKLTPEEKNDIVLFLKTLTDRNFLYDKRFSDPFSTNYYLKDTH
jgi:cytochrome c peroxidase